MVKRILAALLTVAMLLSVCSVEAFAAETVDPETCEHDGDFIYEFDADYYENYGPAHNKICAKCGTVVEKDIECDTEIIEYIPADIYWEAIEDLDSEYILYPDCHWVLGKCKYCEESYWTNENEEHDFEEVTTYEVTDIGHIKTSTKTCTLCKGVIVEVSDEIAHEYDDTTGKCACGKEKPECDHASKKAVEIKGKDIEHKIVCTDKCGEMLGTEGHNYVDGVCTECGHKCNHNYAYTAEWGYKDNGDGTHTYTRVTASECETCGAPSGTVTETVEEHFYYSDPDYGVCSCGSVVPSENAPAASVDVDTLGAVVRELEEKYPGVSFYYDITVKDASETVPAADKELVELDTSYTVGQYLNIELVNTMFDEYGWSLGTVLETETKNLLTITINVPEALLATGRTFSIVRVHDGIVTVLKDEDSDPNTITFSTNQFSTYAIVYKDTVAVEEQEEKGTSVGRTPDMPTAPFGAYVVDMGDNHGIIYGGHIISMPHTYNAAGVCTSCGHER